MRPIAVSTFLLAAAALTASAQMVVSAHSGTLDYFEGDVSIDGIPVQTQHGHFDQLKEQSVLRTGKGRAEVLLTPGVFLRIGENSAMRLLDNRLESTRVELVSGSATLESDAEPVQGKYKTPPVTLIFKDYEIQPVKEGLLEITTDPAQVRVFKGEASVHGGDNHVTVKDGHEVFLTAALATEKFDEKSAADDNYLWARDRSAQVSAANMSSARMIANGGSGYGLNSLGLGGYGLGGYGFGPYWGSSIWGASLYGGGWFYNPLFGMYTYIPMNGFAFSPFGYGFYSPAVINSVYVPPSHTWSGGGGPRTGGVVARPVSGPAGFSRGAGGIAPATRPVTSANVISGRAASAAMAGRSEGFSRGGFSGPAAPSGGMSSGGGISRGAGAGGGFHGGAPAGGGGVRGR